MNKYFLLISLNFTLFVGSVNAQDDLSNNYSDTCNRCITVMGYASKKIEPNTIYLKYLIKENAKTPTEFSIKNVEKEINHILLTLNIPEKNLTTVSVSGYENFNYKDNSEIDYVRTKGYVIKLNDSEQVNKFIISVKNYQLEELQIVRFDHTELLSFAREIQVEAFKNGLETANKVLQVYGEECGEVINIRETQAEIIWPYVYGQNGNLHYSIFNSEHTAYEINQIISNYEQNILYEYQVELTFRIK